MSTRTFAGIAAAALVVSASGTAVANAAPRGGGAAQVYFDKG